MRERLIELIKIAKDSPEITCPHPEWGSCSGCEHDVDGECCNYSRLADHLLANGVIVLPAILGTTVYFLAQPCGVCECYNEPTREEFIDQCRQCDRREIIQCDFDYNLIPEYGKNVFLTQEEAEAALKGGRCCGVKHGEWLANKGYKHAVCFCSICNHGMPFEERGDYCPSCGAKMDGRSENHD